MPKLESFPRKAVSPVMDSALATVSGSPAATSKQPSFSASHAAAGSAAAEALAAALGDPLPAGVHAARTRSMAVETALQRKIFRIQ
jgi:hypothetical protein